MTVHSIADGLGAADLDASPFVREFGPDIRAALLGGAVVKVFHKSETVFEAGEQPDKLCIVLTGMVELCGTLRNAHCGVHFMTAGDLIFPTAVLHGEPSLTSVNALTRTRMLMIERAALVEQAAAHPEVALSLARIAGAQWRMAVRHIIDLKCRSAAERLAAFLLNFVDYSEEEVTDLPFTKATLADRLGVSRETLSRIIQVVADNGIVLRGSRILVRDRAKAEKLCEPEPYIKPTEEGLDVHVL